MFSISKIVCVFLLLFHFTTGFLQQLLLFWRHCRSIRLYSVHFQIHNWSKTIRGVSTAYMDLSINFDHSMFCPILNLSLAMLSNRTLYAINRRKIPHMPTTETSNFAAFIRRQYSNVCTFSACSKLMTMKRNQRMQSILESGIKRSILMTYFVCGCFLKICGASQIIMNAVK